ncbi:MAG: SH3 domain-containing protein [Maritimibacter sp.]
MTLRTASKATFTAGLLFILPVLAQAQTTFPQAAQSLGGNLRADPAQDAKQLGTLGKGEVLELVEDTGQEYHGYTWFKVNARGYTGFVWGGMICSEGHHLTGVFAAC